MPWGAPAERRIPVRHDVLRRRVERRGYFVCRRTVTGDTQPAQVHRRRPRRRKHPKSELIAAVWTGNGMASGSRAAPTTPALFDGWMCAVNNLYEFAGETEMARGSRGNELAHGAMDDGMARGGPQKSRHRVQHEHERRYAEHLDVFDGSGTGLRPVRHADEARREAVRDDAIRGSHCSRANFARRELLDRVRVADRRTDRRSGVRRRRDGGHDTAWRSGEPRTGLPVRTSTPTTRRPPGARSRGSRTAGWHRSPRGILDTDRIWVRHSTDAGPPDYAFVGYGKT